MGVRLVLHVRAGPKILHAQLSFPAGPETAFRCLIPLLFTDAIPIEWLELRIGWHIAPAATSSTGVGSLNGNGIATCYVLVTKRPCVCLPSHPARDARK